jgi:hypothetical protein
VSEELANLIQGVAGPLPQFCHPSHPSDARISSSKTQSMFLLPNCRGHATCCCLIRFTIDSDVPSSCAFFGLERPLASSARTRSARSSLDKVAQSRADADRLPAAACATAGRGTKAATAGMERAGSLRVRLERYQRLVASPFNRVGRDPGIQ